jgi:hypothetical protein
VAFGAILEEYRRYVFGERNLFLAVRIRAARGGKSDAYQADEAD